jgi:hypothetical protein
VIGQAFEQTARPDILLHYTKGQSFITQEIKAKIKFLSWQQHDPAVPGGFKWSGEHFHLQM